MDKKATELIQKQRPSLCYILSDLTECMTKEEWKEWFEKNTKDRPYQNITEFDAWFSVMERNVNMIPCNVLAFFRAPAANGLDTNVLISVHNTEAEEYYELSADGGSVSGDWKDINEAFHDQTGMKLEDHLLKLLKEKKAEYKASKRSIWFVYGNTEVTIKTKETEEIVKWIDIITRM